MGRRLLALADEALIVPAVHPLRGLELELPIALESAARRL
jgi:hypothetical protein